MTDDQDREQAKEATAEALALFVRQQNLTGEDGKASTADAAAALQRQARRQ